MVGIVLVFVVMMHDAIQSKKSLIAAEMLFEHRFKSDRLRSTIRFINSTTMSKKQKKNA